MWLRCILYVAQISVVMHKEKGRKENCFVYKTLFICSYYKCSKMICTGKMAPPDENFVTAHSQHRQNFSSGPSTSNF